MGDLEKFAVEVEVLNREHGWYDCDRTAGDDIALLVTEVGELFDAYREHGLKDATLYDNPDWISNPKPEGVGAEAADTLIRLLDLCTRWGIDLEAEYHRKMAYNATRPYKHGGKKL